MSIVCDLTDLALELIGIPSSTCTSPSPLGAAHTLGLSDEDLGLTLGLLGAGRRSRRVDQ